MTRKFNSRVMTMIAAVLALWLGTAVHAAPPDVPAAGHGRYVVVLWMPGTLLPGQKHGDAPRKLAEPDLAAFDATLLSRRDNELVVDMPPGKARALRRHEAVMYVQRIWMGEDTAGWNESYPRRGFEVASQSDTDITWEAAYTYDAAGNIKTMGEHAFEYDGVDRVLSDKVNGATIESYTYDAFGNRISVTAGSVLVQTPADPSTNRLTAAAYDAAGNVTQTGNTLLKYDSLNMAVEVQGTGVTPRRFIYDADDERLGWMASNLQRWTVRDFAGRTLREFKSGALTHAWDWQRDYIYAEGTLIAGEQQEWGYEYTPEYRYGGDRHYHLDHLGSVRIVSNEQGRSVAEYSFAPFGVQQNQSFQEQDNRLDPNTIDTMRFAGHARDYYGAAPEYGGAYLDYMHARYYGPAVGRFMSVDPTWESADLGRPQSWNRYAYVLNNPINKVDPDGRLQQDVNGNIIFIKTGSNKIIFAKDRPMDNGNTISISWQADIGYVLTDDGGRVEASKATSEMSLTVRDAKGNVVVAGGASMLPRGYDNSTDCHGVTFAKGQVWINNDQVSTILKGDGYVKTATPGVGSVGIYTTNGKPSTTQHSVTVTGVDANGTPNQVYSKGGITPPVTTTPGPGPGTGWHDPKVKLDYYEKKKP